jgi:hypothetical protein
VINILTSDDKSRILVNKKTYRRKIKYGFVAFFSIAVILRLFTIVLFWYIDSQFVISSIKLIYIGILLINFCYLIKLRMRELENDLFLDILSNSFIIRNIRSDISSKELHENFKGLRISVIDIDEYNSKKQHILSKNDVILILQDFKEKPLENLFLFQESENGRIYIEMYHQVWYKHSHILYTNYLINRYKLIEEFCIMISNND